MTINQALKFYGSQVAVAAALGCTQPCVSNWKKRNRIPDLQQLKLQAASSGALKADRRIVG